MDTCVQVQITCTLAELRNHAAFVRAAEFGGYDSEVTITCTDTKQSKLIVCHSLRVNCYGWRHFKDEWERQYGRLNP